MCSKKVLYFYLLLFTILSHSISSYADELNEIVVLSSYHIGFKWTSDIDNAIIKYFEKDESTRLYHEFMDSKRFQDSEYFDLLKQTYQQKFKYHKINGVICSDNKAFEFFIENGTAIWGDVPAVFCGVNNIEDYSHLIDSTKHAVVLEKLDIFGTIDLITQLQPDIQEIIAISDQTLSGKIFTLQFIDGITPFSNNISYKTLDASNPKLLKEQLENTDPTGKAIYLLSLYTNRNGIANEMMKESQYFFSNVNIPVYSNWDFLMPNCIVGGKILKGSDQGTLAAELIMKLIKGQKTPLYTTPKQRYIFDQAKLDYYNLKVPETIANYQIINQPHSFISEFKQELLFLLIILLTLLFVITILVSDMIKRKKIELDLIKSEKRLELAVDGANEGLWDIDYNSKEAYFNERFAILLGYTSTEELNLTFDNWIQNIHPEDINNLQQSYNKHKKGLDDAFRCEVRIKNKKEEYNWFSILGRITEHFNNEPHRITGIIQNINQQKIFEQELRQAKEKAEESDRLKSSFLANMSHEIRTPMNAILGFTDLILENNLNEDERNEYLALVKKSGENLLTLINDIIDISKIESGQMKINFQMTDLHQMFKELQSLANSLIISLNKPIDFKISVENIDQPFFVKTDQLRLYQILLNLVSNAIKFTENGFIEISYTENKSDNIEISVRDTGPGISDNDKKIIFDRFRQIDESTIKKHGGTGLGLSITKSLTELMNGTISVKSPTGGGAEFIVALPCLVSETVSLSNN